MQALVTGGAGFIGSSIAGALLERGWDVRILDNFMTGFEVNVPEGAEVLREDLRDLEAVRAACRNVDVVFHQAAFKSVPKSLNDPMLAETCNSVGTMHLLMGAERHGVRRVVYASSSSVYGNTDGIKVETMATNPISPYGVSKLAGEQYCRVWSHIKGLSTVCLRYFNVFGPRQHPDSTYSAVFPAFVTALAEGRAPVIYGDGEQSRDFTFIDDVVRANLLAAEAGEAASGQVMNVSPGNPRTVNQVLAGISKAMDVSIDPVHQDRRTGDILHSHGDYSRAKQLIGWNPQCDWDHSVKQTTDWILAQPPSG